MASYKRLNQEELPEIDLLCFSTDAFKNIYFYLSNNVCKVREEKCFYFWFNLPFFPRLFPFISKPTDVIHFFSHKVGHSHLLELQWPSLYLFRPMHACFNLQCMSWHTDSSINSVCDVRLAEHSGCVTRLGCVFFILMCPFCSRIQEQVSVLMLTPGLTGLAL